MLWQEAYSVFDFGVLRKMLLVTLLSCSGLVMLCNRGLLLCLLFSASDKVTICWSPNTSSCQDLHAVCEWLNCNENNCMAVQCACHKSILVGV